MNDHLHDEEAIFHIARRLPPDQRAVYLKQICGDDHERRKRIELLLQAHEAEGFLEMPSAEAAATIDQPLTECPGAVIGHYKLLQKIGEGGFGVVFMAEQRSPMVRKVALKVIKPGMDSRAVVARFEAERQALALMDHPNIAHIFDGGTTDSGRPYFVMELVKGVPITEYCDRNQSTTDERLQLFLTVCSAVQHAHQKGIIHRDLKPSNIMVTLDAGNPVVKVIDFGVAKALNQPLTEKTLFTAYGQMIGTLQYMSPEQAEMSRLDVDTRSDVYALGVILYELLTGTTPIEAERLRTAGYAEMQRLIREEDPPRPSVRLSTLGERLSVVAKQRNIDPNRLRQQLRGELDWIVMKSLEKDRARRYESASDMAADVERSLKGEAVEACPPSVMYSLRKTVRRHKGLAAATLAIMAVLVVGIAGASWAKILAEREAERYSRLLYLAEMHASGRDWDSNNVAMVETRLGRYRSGTGQEKHRGWEWYHLWHEWKRDSDVISDALPVHAIRVAASPDGRFLAAASPWGEYVTLWDVERREKIKEFGSKDGTLFVQNFVAFSSSSKTLVYPSDGFSRLILHDIRDLVNGKEASLEIGDGTKFTMAVFHPREDILAAANDDGRIRVWDAATRSVIQEFDGHDSPVMAIAFVPHGDLIISGDSRGQLLVWDASSGETVRPLVGHIDHIHGIAVSPDGKHAATASRDRTVKLWDLDSGELLRTLGSFSDEARSVAFSPDGALLAAGIRSGPLHVWETDTFAELEPIRGFRGTNLSFLPDGRLTFQLWSRSQAICRPRMVSNDRIFAGTEAIFSMALIPKENDLVLVACFRTPQSVVHRWRVREQGIVDMGTLDPGFFVGCLAASENGLLALGDVRGENFVLYDGPDASAPPLSLETNGVQAFRKIAFFDDALIAAGCADGKVIVWRRDAGSSEWKIVETWQAHSAGVSSLAFNPVDSRMLVTGSHDNIARVWNWENQQQLRPELTLDDTVFSAAFSLSGNQLSLGTFGSDIELLDLDSGTRRQLKGHFSHVNGIAYLKDHKTLISAGADRVVKIWDLPTGQERCNLQGDSSIFTCLAVSPDERLIAAGARDGTIRLYWRATEEQVKAAGW